MKHFNTTAVCIPSKHYMVDISERVGRIKQMVDEGKYFTINRARQYGKTTTLNILRHALNEDYTVLSLDFQSMDAGVFENGTTFSQGMARLLIDLYEFEDVAIPPETLEALKELNTLGVDDVKLDDLFRILRKWIKKTDRPIVLMIDEVDSATNNQVFLDFLAQLREQYIGRDTRQTPAFHSVILAGVTDIKHLKGKIRPEDQSKVNSPWNIAADFDIDMSLSEAGIRGMLEEYESDHKTGMDTAAIAKLIRDYTNGYPFLVSRICQLIDEKLVEMNNAEFQNLSEAWTTAGVETVVKMILVEKNTLFDSLTSKLNNMPEIKTSLKRILMEGIRLAYSPDRSDITQLLMYGFVRTENGLIVIDNRIFETRLYNLFLSDEEIQSNAFSREGDRDRNIFVEKGKLNVRLIMEHFIETYHQVYGPLEERFSEKDGRELFLLYLKPIINGTGNYYIEAQTRDQKRTDVVIDYLGQQYIIELKIWRGERYNESGEKQIIEYLDYFGLATGYMLSFNFNKKKQTGVEMVHIGDKTLYEGTV